MIMQDKQRTGLVSVTIWGALILLCGSTGVNAAEDYSTWPQFTTITLNTTPSGANVANNVLSFPLMIRLYTQNFPDFSTSGYSPTIRFAKLDGTHLPYQIERWDDTKDSAEIWVLLDTIKGNSNSQQIKMYWGKTGAADS